MTEALTKDLVKVPQMWRLAMEIGDRHVDVLMTSSMSDEDIIYRRLALNPAMSHLAALEDLIYENPLLLSEFAHVDILINTQRFTFVPLAPEGLGIAADTSGQGPDNASAEDMARVIWPDPELAFVEQDLPRCGYKMAIAVDQGLIAFLRRTFLEAEITHRIAVLAAYFYPLSQQGNSGKIYASVGAKKTDVVAFCQKNPALRIANTYACASVSDITYYVLAAAQDAGFDLAYDEIHVCGDHKMRAETMASLASIAARVMPVILPSAIAFYGDATTDVPFHLLATICE